MATSNMFDVTDDPVVGRTGLVARYIGQMIRGCQTPQCTEILCRTGCANGSKRPFRDYTARSARAIAISICLGPNPSSHACRFYRPPSDGLEVNTSSKRDSSALMQQLCETPSLRQIGSSSRIFVSRGTAEAEPSEATTDDEHAQQPFDDSSSSQKIERLRRENHAKMSMAYRDAQKARDLRLQYKISDVGLPQQVRHAEEPYLVLRVSRKDILEDTFDQLWQRRIFELLRPLRVRLIEADGTDISHDAGGVQIEFFNLLCRQLLSSDTQMFVTDDDTGQSYFKPGSLQPLFRFELCGIIFALAVYNGIPLPVDMKRAFYSPILWEEPEKDPSLPDSFIEGWPTLAKSIQTIHQHDVEGLSFLFPMEANGLRLEFHWPQSSERPNLQVSNVTPIVHHDAESMVSGPATSRESTIDFNDITDALPGWRGLVFSREEADAVTSTNKRLYAQRLRTWHMSQSVSPQQTSFLQGFFRIMDRHILQECFESTAKLQRYIEGSKHLDIHSLRSITKYDGFDLESKDTEYIKSFWDIVISWPLEKQKLLLKFVTASDRIPSLGVSNMQFVIKKSNPENIDRLPTSSTCFSTLQLPVYPSPTILAEKLSLAVELGAEGFGIV